MGLVPEHLKTSPNTKMFLRSFWYRATLKQVVTADEMHIYTLARWVLRSAGRLSWGLLSVCTPVLLQLLPPWQQCIGSGWLPSAA